jgi:hypothetical protein
MIRLAIDGIVDSLQALRFRVHFAFGVSETTTKYVDIVRMISSIPSLTVYELARRCTPSALCLGLGLLMLTGLVLLDFVALLLLLLLLVLKTPVRPAG